MVFFLRFFFNWNIGVDGFLLMVYHIWTIVSDVFFLWASMFPLRTLNLAVCALSLIFFYLWYICIKIGQLYPFCHHLTTSIFVQPWDWKTRFLVPMVLQWFWSGKPVVTMVIPWLLSGKPLDPMVFQWCPMVVNHWSHGGTVMTIVVV